MLFHSETIPFGTRLIIHSHPSLQRQVRQFIHSSLHRFRSPPGPISPTQASPRTTVQLFPYEKYRERLVLLHRKLAYFPRQPVSRTSSASSTGDGTLGIDAALVSVASFAQAAPNNTVSIATLLVVLGVIAFIGTFVGLQSKIEDALRPLSGWLHECVRFAP